MVEWILYTINVEIFDCSTEAWEGKVISRGMRRHQNDKCFNCDRIEHLRRDFRQGILEIMSPLGMTKIEGLKLLDYVKVVVNTDNGPRNREQQMTNKETRYQSGNSLGDLLQHLPGQM